MKRAMPTAMSDAQTAPPREADLPPLDGSAPLAEVGRDGLSVFIYLAFTDDELDEIWKSLRLSVPGFRLEKMSAVQKADHLADEIRAAPDAADVVLELLREIYEFPALDDVALTAPVAERLAVLSEEDDSRVRLLWRLLADPAVDIRKTAHATLEHLAKSFYGGGEKGAPAAPEKKPERPRADPAEVDRDVKRAEQIAEKAQTKAEALAAQLKEARSASAETQRELSHERKAKERALADVARLEAQVEKLKAQTKGAPSEKHERELAHALEQAAALKAKELELSAALEEAKSAAPADATAESPDREEEVGVEDAPAGWSMPRFTQEFYDSLPGWDVRLQRAAFKQAYLLSENWSHPSLRALALEGLEGYYRVRVATDVRLIYRRSSEGEIDICSLIDREDLDRYVRQAKTR